MSKTFSVNKDKLNLDYNQFIELLKKDKDDLEPEDKSKIITYLSENVEYFKNLFQYFIDIPLETKSKSCQKKSSKEKLSSQQLYNLDDQKEKEKSESKKDLISALNFEQIKENETIMIYGEKPTKLIILLKGFVSLYKPFQIEKYINISEYDEYLTKIKEEEKNLAKYYRIKEYNSRIERELKSKTLDFNGKEIIPNRKHKFIFEEESKVGVCSSGTYFGVFSLYKNEPYNFTIKTNEPCDIITVNKNDYTNLIKNMEKQRLDMDSETLKKGINIFKNWPTINLYKLFDEFITEKYVKDDFIYKQNDIPEFVYYLTEGELEVYSDYNFYWYEQFIDYIHDSSLSLLNDIEDPFLRDKERTRKKINKLYNESKSPFLVNKTSFDNIITSNFSPNKTIINDITNQSREEIKSFLVKQMERNSEIAKKNIYKANIQILKAPQIFGCLEAFEIKRRFSTIKCFTDATIKKIPFLEFLQLLLPCNKKLQFYIEKSVFREKKYLIEQLKKNALTKINFISFNNNNNSKLMKLFDPKRKPSINNNEFKFQNFKVYKLSKSKSETNLEKKINNLKNTNYTNSVKLFENQKLMQITKNNNIFKLNNDNNNFKSNSVQKNEIVFGFKNDMLNFTREKLENLKTLYPKQLIKKSNLILSVKKFNSHDDDYLKYLENNSSVSNKTPSNFISHMNLPNFGITAKYNCKVKNSKNTIQKINSFGNLGKKTNYSGSFLMLPSINQGTESFDNKINNIICNSNKATKKKVSLIEHMNRTEFKHS